MQLKRLFGVTLLVTCLGILLPLMSENVRINNQINAAEEKPKVLLFIRHGTSANANNTGTDETDHMISEEVNVMSNMLKESGFDVVIASASGEPLEGQTTKLIPDITLADVNVEEYAGIMLPCFATGSHTIKWHASPEEITLIQDAVASGKLIAAQHGAIIILVEAGVLAEKKYAYSANLAYYGYGEGFAEAIYSGKGVIQDGSIITSSYCPRCVVIGGVDRTVELTELFIHAIQAESK